MRVFSPHYKETSTEEIKYKIVGRGKHHQEKEEQEVKGIKFLISFLGKDNFFLG